MTEFPLPAILRAAAFAADKHRTQRRKDHASSPFINHPLAVANVLAAHGVTDPVVSDRARLVKLGDKICNARDVSMNPPAEWSRNRRREYVEWTQKVVAGCRGVHPELEGTFDGVAREAVERLDGMS